MTDDERDAQRYRLIKREKELKERQEFVRRQIKSMAGTMKTFAMSLENSGDEGPYSPQRPNFELLINLLAESRAVSVELGENVIKMTEAGC